MKTYEITYVEAGETKKELVKGTFLVNAAAIFEMQHQGLSVVLTAVSVVDDGE